MLQSERKSGICCFCSNLTLAFREQFLKAFCFGLRPLGNASWLLPAQTRAGRNGGDCMDHKLGIAPAASAGYCERHHIWRLFLFGSRLKGTARLDSDIDLLVEFVPAHVPGLQGIAAMEIKLSQLMAGRKLDLRTAGDLSRYFRDEVAYAAEMQYAR